MYRYYLIVMLGGPALLAGIGRLAGNIPILWGLLAAYGATVAAFGIGALAATLTRAFPPRFFNPLSKRYQVRKWERRALVRIGIRSWKDKIPEVGALLGYLSKKRVTDRNDNDYLLHFMTETCYAEVMHLVCCFVGFLIVIPALFFDHRYLFFLILPVAVINAILHFLPVLVQRYVRPFLLHAYLHNQAKKAPQEALTQAQPIS